MDIKEQRVLKCEDCGATFFGLFAKYCEVCRKKRRQTRSMYMKVCEVCGKRKKMYEDQVVCRLCKEEKLREERSEAYSIQQIEALRLSRKTGGKLLKIDRCSNYNAQNITCAICSPGAWEYKDCGVKK